MSLLTGEAGGPPPSKSRVQPMLATARRGCQQPCRAKCIGHRTEPEPAPSAPWAMPYALSASVRLEESPDEVVHDVGLLLHGQVAGRLDDLDLSVGHPASQLFGAGDRDDLVFGTPDDEDGLSHWLRIRHSGAARVVPGHLGQQGDELVQRDIP